MSHGCTYVVAAKFCKVSMRGGCLATSAFQTGVNRAVHKCGENES